MIRENILKTHNLDICRFNSDNLYKLIKHSKITYEMLTKEVLLDVIIKSQNNFKIINQQSIDAISNVNKTKRYLVVNERNNNNIKNYKLEEDFSTKRKGNN